MTFAEAQKSFLSRCYSQNLSELTIDWYARKLKLLGRVLAEKGVVDIESVTAIHVREYLAILRQSRQSMETIFRTWGALKCYFRFLHLENVIKINIMDRVERPRRERHIIQPLSMPQVHALLKMPTSTEVRGVRDRALMLLMVDSGLRLSEAISLRTDRIHWDDSQVTVMGKGRKERVIPIGETTRAALADYARLRKKSDLPCFFLSRRSHPMKNRYVQVAMRKYGREAAITGVRVSPHTLRHTFAIQYIKNGGDVFSLQAILGHSTLDMVRNYVNLAQRDVSTQHRKFSPIDYIQSSSTLPS
jgi:integrase/recombinase XerD